MGLGPDEAREKQQFFAAKAEQAEERARKCDDESICESWISIANSWRLLAENAGKNSKP